jgi:hypothetical protein
VGADSIVTTSPRQRRSPSRCPMRLARSVDGFSGPRSSDSYSSASCLDRVHEDGARRHRYSFFQTRCRRGTHRTLMRWRGETASSRA